MSPKRSSESVVRDIKRRTRKKFSAEEKIRIVEGINPNLYYRWSKDFLEAGKKRFQGDTVKEANSSEVTDLRQENDQLKQLVAELSLKNRVLKNSLNGMLYICMYGRIRVKDFERETIS